MFKVLAVLCIFLALSAVNTQSCSSTSTLRSKYGFTSNIQTAVTAPDAQFCKSIKNSPVCCTANEINSIDDMSQAIVQNITNMVMMRDVVITQLRELAIPKLQESLRGFAPLEAQFDAIFEEYSAAHEDDNSTDYNSTYYDPNSYSNYTDDNSTEVEVEIDDMNFFFLLVISEIFEELANIADTFLGNLTEIQTGYVAYQKARTTCVIEMMNIQNAAICLSCDPSASSKGFSIVNNTFQFDMSERVCSRVKGACREYFADAELQNSLIAASYNVAILSTLADLVTDLMTGDLTELDQADSLQNDTEGVELAPALTIPQIPDDSDWICDTLFYDGVVDQESLVVGGNAKASPYDDEEEDGGRRRRLLQRHSSSRSPSPQKGNRRMLSGGNFNPDSDESGVRVTFSDDPAGTNNSKFGSMSMGSVFMSMMVIISSILLL